MTRCTAVIVYAALLILITQVVSKAADAPEGDFESKVRPILAAKCLSCHGPEQQKSGYRLDVREIALRGGELGEPAIVPGNSRESPLMRYVADPQADIIMPPKESSAGRLTAMEVAILQAWIDQGAVWPDSANVKLDSPENWWSFKPLQAPEIPEGFSNPIDAFVTAKLKAKRLTLSPPADPRTLARRAYFDMHGLPPSPEELARFATAAEVDAEAAWNELVESLLASPRYGERWARHWLDIVHYGDTHGYDKDKPRPNAWPYRDYVIRAFNEDKPYLRFIEEQIAGDILYPDTRDGIEAMGFIAAGPWDFIGHAEVPETKIDGKIARHLDRDDMVANTLGTFCSVTVHCAQCHNHKFDPISQEDYYSLQAVFAALDRTDRKYYPDEATLRQYHQLEQLRRKLESELQAIDLPLRKLAGQAYSDLTSKIDQASKPVAKTPNPGPEFGFHSQIAQDPSTTKWVQVDLGQRTEIVKVNLMPCYDDFNNIGSGFGFPVRFKIEASDDPEFKSGVALFWRRHDQTFMNDFANPGLQTFTAQGPKDDGFAGRYLRITATKLAPRQNDFIFALAELEVYDLANQNVAKGKEVTALDSIEAGPRWRKSNLTDGLFPKPATDGDTLTKEQLVEQREALLNSLAAEVDRHQRQTIKSQLLEIGQSLAKIPPPSLIYAGGVHHGTGTFKGTGNDGGRPRPIFLLARGQVTNPTKEVGPGSLSALTFRPSRFEIPADAQEGMRRVELAKWITDRSNPLTFRSIVNRVWQYHFGRGLVDTPNDFGRNGSLPSHPELLDWLASQFRHSGGSLKQLHRLILTSATYRQSSSDNVRARDIDSDNTLLWRQNRRRLEAEAVRDAVLVVSGKMNFTMGGPGWQDFKVEHPEHSPHYEYGLADPEDASTWRRAIYRFIVRSQTQPWMTSLDCADPSMRVDKRNESLSAIQALALLNNGFMLSQARHFAQRVAEERDGVEAQVLRAHELALGSQPDQPKADALITFTRTHGLANLCRVLMNLNAFNFVD